MITKIIVRTINTLFLCGILSLLPMEKGTNQENKNDGVHASSTGNQLNIACAHMAGSHLKSSKPDIMRANTFELPDVACAALRGVARTNTTEDKKKVHYVRAGCLLMEIEGENDDRMESEDDNRYKNNNQDWYYPYCP